MLLYTLCFTVCTPIVVTGYQTKMILTLYITFHCRYTLLANGFFLSAVVLVVVDHGYGIPNVYSFV